MSGLRAFRILIRAKARALWNTRRSGRAGGRRFVALIVLGLLVWVGILVASHWFLARVVSIEPIGIVMLRKLLSLVLVFILSILTVSNLIAALSTLFLADDLPAIVSRPVPTYALFAARWLENAIYASWMTLIFSTPFFVAAGMVMHAPPTYYGTLAVALPAMATLPTSIAFVLALALGRMMSARRTRQILVVLATIVFTVLFVLFRRLQPERFVDPDQRAPLLEVLQDVQGTGSEWLPSAWAADALWRQLDALATVRAPSIALLLTAALAAFFVAGWVFRGLYSEAYSRAQASVGQRGATERESQRRSLSELATRLRRRTAFGTRGVIAAKDLRVFLRDTAQWTQMLLLGALVAIYVVNFSYIRAAGESGIISATGLHFINVALGGFVAVAVCVRFAFPAISLEGRAFWVVLCSPNRALDLLRGKWRSLALPLSLLIAALVGITSVWLGSGWLRTGLAVALVIPMATGMVGLALGLGARFPRFHVDNAAKIATGVGGVLYMMIGLVLLVIDVLLAVPPTVVLAQYLEHRGYLPGGMRTAGAVTSGALAIALPVFAGWLALRIGARHLERHGLAA